MDQRGASGQTLPLVLFSFSPIELAVFAGAASQLPQCCTRLGEHHWVMRSSAGSKSHPISRTPVGWTYALAAGPPSPILFSKTPLFGPTATAVLVYAWARHDTGVNNKVSAKIEHTSFQAGWLTVAEVKRLKTSIVRCAMLAAL